MGENFLDETYENAAQTVEEHFDQGIRQVSRHIRQESKHINSELRAHADASGSEDPDFDHLTSLCAQIKVPQISLDVNTAPVGNVHAVFPEHWCRTNFLAKPLMHREEEQEQQQHVGESVSNARSTLSNILVKCSLNSNVKQGHGLCFADAESIYNDMSQLTAQSLVDRNLEPIGATAADAADDDADHDAFRALSVTPQGPPKPMSSLLELIGAEETKKKSGRVAAAGAGLTKRVKSAGKGAEKLAGKASRSKVAKETGRVVETAVVEASSSAGTEIGKGVVEAGKSLLKWLKKKAEKRKEGRTSNSPAPQVVDKIPEAPRVQRQQTPPQQQAEQLEFEDDDQFYDEEEDTAAESRIGQEVDPDDGRTAAQQQQQQDENEFFDTLVDENDAVEEEDQEEEQVQPEIVDTLGGPSDVIRVPDNVMKRGGIVRSDNGDQYGIQIPKEDVTGDGKYDFGDAFVAGYREVSPYYTVIAVPDVDGDGRLDDRDPDGVDTDTDVYGDDGSRWEAVQMVSRRVGGTHYASHKTRHESHHYPSAKTRDFRKHHSNQKRVNKKRSIGFADPVGPDHAGLKRIGVHVSGHHQQHVGSKIIKGTLSTHSPAKGRYSHKKQSRRFHRRLVRIGPTDAKQYTGSAKLKRYHIGSQLVDLEEQSPGVLSSGAGKHRQQPWHLLYKATEEPLQEEPISEPFVTGVDYLPDNRDGVLDESDYTLEPPVDRRVDPNPNKHTTFALLDRDGDGYHDDKNYDGVPDDPDGIDTDTDIYGDDGSRWERVGCSACGDKGSGSYKVVLQHVPNSLYDESGGLAYSYSAPKPKLFYVVRKPKTTRRRTTQKYYIGQDIEEDEEDDDNNASAAATTTTAAARAGGDGNIFTLINPPKEPSYFLVYCRHGCRRDSPILARIGDRMSSLTISQKKLLHTTISSIMKPVIHESAYQMICSNHLADNL